MDQKLKKLQQILREMESVIVAYSGGVDSSLLLKVAHDVLGDKAIAVTAISEVTAIGELDDAKNFACEIGAKHIIVETAELEDEAFAKNPSDRCYHCKKELFSKLLPMAADENVRYVVYGANLDDVGDHRPGMKAASDMSVRAPLLEAAFTKADIRAAAKQLGLTNWERPALACLASRIPYGTRITKENLSQVDQAELTLRKLGFAQVRVRHHGDIARIEVLAEDLVKVTDLFREEIIAVFKKIGYKYVTLDLQGYRSGSMNETL